MATIINMPKLSDTMTAGTLTQWLKKAGEPVSNGDIVAEVETDKATMELENFEDGVLLACYLEEGGEVPVGAPIYAVGKKGETPPPRPKDKRAKPKKGEAADTPPEAADALEETGSNKGGRIVVSPLAKKIADEQGIAISQIEGSGPGGRITKKDVLLAKKQGSAPSAGSPGATLLGDKAIEEGKGLIADEQALPVSNKRGIIARRLSESNAKIPHFYLENEIDAGPLLGLRAALNKSIREAGEADDHKLTINDFILKACVEALRRAPAVNRSWMGDTIQQHGAVHLAFGVALDDALLTPVIRDAQSKGIRQISEEARTLTHKARNKKLTPDEMKGSTFTVTNLGMYGIEKFYGIVNPPNAAILSVGTALRKPVADDFDNIVVGYRMSLGLSCDHRVIDGATAAYFFAAIKEILESPGLLMA